MKKAVITGATGAIGVALIEELIQHGTSVLVLARRGGRSATLPSHPKLEIVPCDLADLLKFRTPCTDYDVFYHLAWAGTAGAARNDAALQCANVKGAIDAVELAARLGCHTFVGVGSQAEYGRTNAPLTEDTPTAPESGYGMAKLAASGLTRLCAEGHGMRHVWVRILSVYGPHDRENSLISYTVRGLLRAEPLRFTKAEQHWDLLYSRDAARALALLGERGRHGGIYPLGSGRAKPLREYLTRARDLLAPQVPLYFGALDYPDGQVMHLEADIRRLRADTGFVPSTDFDEGILKTAAWWKNQT